MKRIFTTFIVAGALLLNSNQTQAQCYSAVQLDGVNDYLHSPFSTYNFNNFTIEMWINSANYLANDIYVVINQGSHFGIGGWQGDGSFNIFTDGFAPSELNSGSGTTPATGAWVHVAYVYDGSNRIIYIDGTPVFTFVTTATVQSGNGNNYGLVIGSRFDGTQQYTNTAFEDIRVWGVARTQAELTANMSLNLTGSETGLYAYYRFEDGAGSNTVTDLTGNGNTLTLNNADPSTVWVSGLFAQDSEGIDVVSSCGPYTWIDGNTYPTNNNTATHTILGGAAGGCDSIVTLDLTIHTEVDPTVSTNSSDITSNDVTAGNQYQWIDCDNNNMPILGETNVTFSSPPSGGNYSVIVTAANGCTDTSECVLIATNTINETFSENVINIFPNPTKSELNIATDQNIESIVIVGIMGQKVKMITSNFNSIDVSDLKQGVYFIQLETVSGLLSKRFIKE